MTGRATEEASLSYVDLLTDRPLVVVLLVSVAGSLGTNIASPAIPAIADAFAVTDARAGLVVTTFSLTSMVAVPVASALADIYGRRVVAVTGVLGFGTTGAVIALAGSFEVLLLLRALQGVAFAGTAPLAVTLLGDMYDGNRGSAAQGMRASAHGISSILSPALAGFAAGLLWTYPFLLYALCVPVAWLAYRYLPRHDAIGSDPAAGVGSTFREYARALRAEMAAPGLKLLLAGGVALFLVRVAVLTFVPLFAVGELGASTFVAGLLLSLRGVVRIVVAPTVGTLTAWLSRRRVLVGSFAVSTLGAGLIGLAGSVPWLAAAIGLYSVGLSVCFPVLNDAVVSVPREEYRAGVVGGFSMLKSAASTASPVLFGAVLSASSYEVMFLAAGLLSAGYTVALAVLAGPAGDSPD